MATIHDLCGRESATGIGIALEKCNIVSPDDFSTDEWKSSTNLRTVRFEQTQQKKQKKWRRMREETSSGRNILIKAYFYDNDFSRGGVHQCSGLPRRRDVSLEDEEEGKKERRRKRK